MDYQLMKDDEELTGDVWLSLQRENSPIPVEVNMALLPDEVRAKRRSQSLEDSNRGRGNMPSSTPRDSNFSLPTDGKSILIASTYSTDIF